MDLKLAAPGRHAAAFPTFEQVLDWLLDGLARHLSPGGELSSG